MPPTVAAENPKIKLGAVVSLSGKQATRGNREADGYKFAAQVINQTGGIKVGGKRFDIDLHLLDDGSKKDDAQKLATQLILQEGVQFILLPTSSPDPTAIANVANKWDAVVITTSPSASLFSGRNRNLFGIAAMSDDPYGPAFAFTRKQALGAGRTSESIRAVAAVDPDGTDMKGSPNIVLSARGAAIANIETKDMSGSPAWLEHLAAGLRLDPVDVVVLSGPMASSVKFIEQLRTAFASPLRYPPSKKGTPATIVFSPSCDVLESAHRPETKRGATRLVETCLTQWSRSLPYSDNRFGSAANFAHDFQKTYWYSATPLSAGAAAAVHVFAEAFRRTKGQLEPNAVRAALREGSFETFFGPVRFDEAGKNPAKPPLLGVPMGTDVVIAWPPSLGKEIAAGEPVPASEETRAKTARVENLTWNAWVEKSSDNPTYEWKKFLDPESRSKYKLYLDLAPFLYEKRKGVFAKRIGQTLVAAAEDWLKDENVKKVTLTAVFIPEPDYFEFWNDAKGVPLEIDIENIRVYLNGKIQKPNGSVFEFMKRGKRPRFVFSRTEFSLTPKKKQGMTSVLVALSKDGRPLSEIVIPLCIAKPSQVEKICEFGQKLEHSIKGVDSLRLGAESGSHPDASLHFVPMNSGRTMLGILWRKDTRTFHTWPLARSPEYFKNYLRTRLIPSLGNTRQLSELQGLGRALFDELFPRADEYEEDEEENRKAAMAARDAFLDFIDKKTGGAAPTAADKTPSIFVRLVKGIREPPVFLPFGMILVKTSQGSEDFLGFKFRIEAPLPRQSYKTSRQCVSRWLTVLPPADTKDPSLQLALADLDKVYEDWQKSSDRFFTDMSVLANWLQQDEDEDKPAAFVAMSHHTDDTIYFQVGGPEVTSAHTVRRFQPPSIGILNGCGTAKVGATDFIRKLNFRHIYSFIATNTEVDPAMAGAFFDCLAKSLPKDSKEQDRNLSRTYFTAIQCLKDRTENPADDNSAKYGPNALKYMLLGNGDVRLCSPSKS